MAARVLVNAVSARLGGGGTYAREQVRALAQQPGLTLTVIATGQIAEDLRTSSPGVRIIARPKRPVVLRLVWEQLAIPLISRRYDVLYSCGNFAVFGARCPQVVVFQNPNHFGRRAKEVAGRFASRRYKLRLKVERVLAAQSLHRAEAVVAISQALRATMAEESQRDVKVVLSATPQIGGAPHGPLLGVPERYVLAVANDYPHKDWDGLIRAFLQSDDLPPLVIVGGPSGERRTRRLEERIRTAGDPGRVLLWGPEPDRGTVNALYAGASAFIAHSFLEAAPLTPYEAVVCGLPVILSDIPPHRECTPGAEFYAPDDIAGLSNAVRRALTSDVPQKLDYRTWEDNAKEIAALLTSLTRRGVEDVEAPIRPRVVIDALAARFGGAAYAAAHVACNLAADSAIGEVIVVARSGSLVAEGAQPGPGLRLVQLRQARRFELVRRVVWEAIALPRLLDPPGATLLTWSGMLPLSVRGRVVCYLANPLVFELEGVAHWVRRWAVGRTARWATDVLVPTSWMGQLAGEAIGRTPDVVPLGIDHERFRPGDAPGQDVLCVADIYPHKRHDIVLAAWARLPVPRPRLRLIGNDQVDPAYARKLKQEAHRHRDLGEIVMESGLRLDDLVAAYQNARVVLVPSNHESFSMPLLEAQACGAPTVARAIPSLQETGGPGTVYIEGDDPEEWAEAVTILMNDEDAHARARQSGIAHAASYGWDRTADAIRDRLAAT